MFLLLKIYFYFMYIGILPYMYMCAHMCLAHEGLKKTLELEL